MDKDQILGEGWIESTEDANDPKSTPANTYAYRRKYADGRVVTQYFRRNQEGVVREATTIDTEQEKRFKDAQAQAGRGDQEGDTRGPQTGPTREVYRGGKWVTEPNPIYQQPATAGDWRTEGTPDGQGGFDNSRPIMVRTVNGKREERQPTAAELKDWNEAGQRTRNPGGKSDAEIAAEKEKADAAAARARGETRADSAEARAAAAAGQPDVKTETVVKNGQTYTRQISTPRNGGPPTIRTFGPDGKELPGGIPGDAQTPTNLPPFVPDWNKPGLGAYEWAAMVRARPDMTDELKDKAIRAVHQDVTGIINQANAVLSAQQAEASRATSERGQDVGMANQRLSTSSSNFATAARQAADDTKYSLGPEAKSVMPYYLAMAQATGMGYGGFNTPPPVQTGAAIGQMQGQTIPGLAGMSTFQPTGATSPVAAGAPPVAGASPDGAAVEAERQRVMGQNGALLAPPPPVGAPPTAGEPGGPPLAPGPVAPTPPGPVPVPDAGAPYTPQAAGGAPIFSPGPRPAPGSINSVPPQPVGPGSPAGGNVQMAPAGGGGLASMLGNVGPWAAQPQQPGQPTGMGALMMQRAGGYDPTGLNRMLMEAGIDPDVIQSLGGVG